VWTGIGKYRSRDSQITFSVIHGWLAFGGPAMLTKMTEEDWVLVLEVAMGRGTRPTRRKVRFGWGTWIRTKIDGVRVRRRNQLGEHPGDYANRISTTPATGPQTIFQKITFATLATPAIEYLTKEISALVFGAFVSEGCISRFQCKD
jgi:hypothetical protein